MQYKVHEEASVPVVLEVPQDDAAYDPEDGLGPVALDTTINFDTTDLIPRLSIEDGVWAYVNATSSNLAPGDPGSRRTLDPLLRPRLKQVLVK